MWQTRLILCLMVALALKCRPGMYDTAQISLHLFHWILNQIWQWQISKRQLQFAKGFMPQSGADLVQATSKPGVTWRMQDQVQQKQGHAAVSGPVDSIQFFKCIFFILWTLTVLCRFCHFGTHQSSVYFPILLLDFVEFPLCFQIPGYQAPAASGFF